MLQQYYSRIEGTIEVARSSQYSDSLNDKLKEAASIHNSYSYCSGTFVVGKKELCIPLELKDNRERPGCQQVQILVIDNCTFYYL